MSLNKIKDYRLFLSALLISKFPNAYFLKSIFLSNFKRLNFPFKLSYAVTYSCNLRCKMCNIWKKPQDHKELNIKQIEYFFKNANSFSWIGITGGEPFLRTDLSEIINTVMTHCSKASTIHFATNGQLSDKIIDLTRRIQRENKKLKIAYTISIDGPPLLHDGIRGVKGAWDKAINTFASLKDIKSVKAQIGHTISLYNIGKFEETLDAIRNTYPAVKFDDITINIFQKSDFYYENQDMDSLNYDKLSIEIKKILKMDNETLSLNNFLRRVYLKGYLKYINTHRCPLKCQALSSTCFLDPYGNLFPCAIYNKKLINIKSLKSDFVDMWNADYAKRLSYECSNYMCPSCWSPCDAYSAIGGSLKKVCFGAI